MALFFLAVGLCGSLRAEFAFPYEEEDRPAEEISRREIRYETASSASGWMRHRWSLNFSSIDKRRASIFFLKNHFAGSAFDTHGLGARFGQDFGRLGFKAGYLQMSRAVSDSARGFGWGSLRFRPLDSFDLFLGYGRSWYMDEDVQDEDLLSSLSAGFRLRASNVFKIQLFVVPEKRLRCDVAYRW